MEVAKNSVNFHKIFMCILKDIINETAVMIIKKTNCIANVV